MSITFDGREMVTRVVKYLMEGLVVAIVAALLPTRLRQEEIVLLALTAAAIFAVLDLVAPSIGGSARAGAGLAMGFKLLAFP